MEWAVVVNRRRQDTTRLEPARWACGPVLDHNRVSPYRRAIEFGRRGAGRPAVAHHSTVDVLALRQLPSSDGGDGGDDVSERTGAARERTSTHEAQRLSN